MMGMPSWTLDLSIVVERKNDHIDNSMRFTSGPTCAVKRRPLALLRQQQELVRKPNLKDPGYIRQKQNAKLWVRERLSALVDKDSFPKLDQSQGNPNAVIGWGRIEGRKVFITADDFSVRGGHADGGIQMKAPYGEIRLLDGSSGGEALKHGSNIYPWDGRTGISMDALAVVPVASALLGGWGWPPPKQLPLFAAGPPVVKQATFEDLSKEELGGWEIHATNGTVDNVPPPVHPCSDDPIEEEELINIIPRRRTRPYDIRTLIHLIVDISGPSSSFFEIGKMWGGLSGRSVGILSSDCRVNGGAIDALGSQKAARFVNYPHINLVDQPGFAIGSFAERTATIRHGASAMSALYNATVPIFTVVIRRAFGVAGGVFGDPDDGRGTRVAWPSGDWGSLPLEGGIEAAYKRQLDATGSPEAREALMTELLQKFEDVRSPIKTAHKFGVEEIIDPRDTRPLACEWATHAYENILPQLLAVKQIRYGYDSKPSSGRGYRL
ncbi:ClpP/crotonase-like domain-containing protein [Infundibulicybe gibba]|nr:ClpP/crotonase-like domain-containing protein [Infundibulicybe gibba]